MKLGVITACHAAHAVYLPHALTSIEEQSSPPDFHVLVSDGSPAAAGLMHQYAQRDPDRRLHIEFPQSRGAAAAWNAGVWQLWLREVDFALKFDADDLMLPRHLSQLRAAILEDPALDVVFTSLISQTEDGRRRTYHFPEYCRSRAADSCCIPAQAAVRTTLLSQVGGVDVTMPAGEDWDLFVRLGLITDLRVRQIPEPGWIYWDHGLPRVSDHLRENISVYRSYFRGHTRDTVLARSRSWLKWCEQLKRGAAA